jgi:hypothetical protein
MKKGSPKGGKMPGAARVGEPRPPLPLQYKVVELSTVDEGSLEQTVNAWVQQGWNLEGIQFAMRESSKRPSMAFVFFTRAAEEAEWDRDGANARLRRIAGGHGAPEARARDPRALAELAGQGASEDLEPSE